MLQDKDLLAHTQHWVLDSPTQGFFYIGWNEKDGRGGAPTAFADAGTQSIDDVDRPRCDCARHHAGIRNSNQRAILDAFAAIGSCRLSRGRMIRMGR